MDSDLPHRCRLLLFATAFTLISLSHADAFAQKGKPGGGTTTRPYRLVTLDLNSGGATAMTEAVTVNGTTTVSVVGWQGELARFWRITSSASDLIQNISLALPAGIDPQSPLASAEAINDQGIIVGGCRLVDSWPGQPLLWEHEQAEPILLPLPDGFTGWAMPRGINYSGIIVGDLSGDFTSAEGTDHVEGLIAWLAWHDADGTLQVSRPTWLPIDVMSVPKLNDAGWVAFDSADGVFRLQLATHLVHDEQLDVDTPEVIMNDLDVPLFGSDTVATVGGINQAGDVAGDFQLLSQRARDIYVKRLDGTFLSMPVYVNTRELGTYVHGIDAVNNATGQHAVQVLGEVGTHYKKSTGLGAWYWAIWESGASVRLLKDITEVPTDSTYDFSSVTSFHDLNDASWICGRIARGESRVGVPAVLIRKP